MFIVAEGNPRPLPLNDNNVNGHIFGFLPQTQK